MIRKIILICLMIHAYANGGNWRYTVEQYTCGLKSVTTKYEYSAPAPAGALTRDQLERKLDQFRHDDSVNSGGRSSALADHSI